MKIAISIGHTLTGSGSGAIGYLNESECTREIGSLVVKYINQVEGYEAKEFRIDKPNSWEWEDCYTRCQQSNSWGADLFVEIHLNCFNEFSVGSEVFVINDNSSAISYAKAINNNICKSIGTVDRTYGKGYKTAGYIVLKNTNCPALLIESLFCSAKSDCDKYDADKIARAISEGITGTTSSSQSNITGWKQDNVGWWYVYDNNKNYYISQWAKIDNEWYYFNEKGYAKQSEWIYSKNVWYYLKNNCKMAKSEWVQVEDEFYCFDSEGAMYSNCVTPDGYRVDESGAWIR